MPLLWGGRWNIAHLHNECPCFLGITPSWHTTKQCVCVCVTWAISSCLSGLFTPWLEWHLLLNRRIHNSDLRLSFFFSLPVGPRCTLPLDPTWPLNRVTVRCPLFWPLFALSYFNFFSLSSFLDPAWSPYHVDVPCPFSLGPYLFWCVLFLSWTLPE